MWAVSESEFLQGINALIDDRLNAIPRNAHDQPAEGKLTAACRHLCVSEHAKRARPLLCLYFHWLLREDVSKSIVNIGVAAEFIHAASLLHDDIIDDADKRRGKPSTNRHFGNATAVLAGDFLLTEAFDLLRSYDRELSDLAITVVREMTKSAILELNVRGSVDLSVEQLCKIAEGKTGILFSWCGYASAYLCDDKEAARKLWEIGKHVGLIFQLADDIKDFDGDHNLKDVCRDIRNFELSVPTLLAIEESKLIKEQFKEAFLQNEISETAAIGLKDLVINSHALKKAKVMMAREIDYVLTVLSPYRNTLGMDRLESFVMSLCVEAN